MKSSYRALLVVYVTLSSGGCSGTPVSPRLALQPYCDAQDHVAVYVPERLATVMGPAVHLPSGPTTHLNRNDLYVDDGYAEDEEAVRTWAATLTEPPWVVIEEDTPSTRVVWLFDTLLSSGVRRIRLVARASEPSPPLPFADPVYAKQRQAEWDEPVHHRILAEELPPIPLGHRLCLPLATQTGAIAVAPYTAKCSLTIQLLERVADQCSWWVDLDELTTDFQLVLAPRSYGQLAEVAITLDAEAPAQPVEPETTWAALLPTLGATVHLTKASGTGDEGLGPWSRQGGRAL